LKATIDGESFNFLFDTGATVNLTNKAIETLGNVGDNPIRGMSFITQSIFEK